MKSRNLPLNHFQSLARLTHWDGRGLNRPPPERATQLNRLGSFFSNQSALSLTRSSIAVTAAMSSFCVAGSEPVGIEPDALIDRGNRRDVKLLRSGFHPE